MKRQLRYAGLLNAIAFSAWMIGGDALGQAAGPQSAEPSGPNDETEVVIVTGTRQSGLTAEDSPAPVQVLDVGALESSGALDLRKSLSLLVPSFNAQATGGDMANNNLAAKLRGVSPNHTLVLVNGKRRHGTASLAVGASAFQGGAAADLGLIPQGSVDHVEVLLEGAAAQYGSDAIAGVLNIIQKKNADGGQITLSGGEYFDGGGRTGDLTANVGLAPTERSWLNLTAEAKYHDFSFRGDADPRVLNTGTPGQASSTAKLSSYPFVVDLPNYPYLNRVSGDAEYRLYTTTYNFGYDPSDHLEIYSFGSYGYKFAQANQNYRLPNLIVGKNGVNPRPLGFTPKESVTENDYQVALGAKGDIADWRYDLSTTYSEDNQSLNVLNSFNRSLYIDTSTTTSSGFSPADFHVGDFIGNQWTTNLDVVRDFNVGWTTPLTLAFGLEYREDGYQIKAGDEASRYKEGSQSYPGFSLTDAGDHSRNSKAAYIDLAGKPIEALQLDAAVRYEKFSDFGDTTVGKLTGRYDFNSAFALRGTISTGFRAPTLAEQYYSATNVSPTSAFVQLPANSAAARLVGVNGLKPEKSKNYSVGFVVHPFGNLTATLDAYQIEIEDRIVGSGQLFGTGGAINSPAVRNAILANGNTLDPTVSQTGISIFSNGLDTRTKGVDFVLTTSSDFGAAGLVDWALTANYTSTKVTRIAPAPSQLAAGVSLFDKTAISYIETAAPKYRFIASASWKLGPLSVDLKEAYYGESKAYLTRTGTPYYESKIGAAFITDLDISYAVTEQIKVSVGANNLFNEYPDRVSAGYRQDVFNANTTGYVAQYPGWSPFGINGGYYYGRVSYSF